MAVAIGTSRLQRLAFKYYVKKVPEFKDFAFLSTSEVGKRDELQNHLCNLSDTMLFELAERLQLFSSASDIAQREIVLEVLLNHFSERDHRSQQICQISLYPDEILLWGDLSNVLDSSSLPAHKFSTAVEMSLVYHLTRPMALPKLKLQFLTFYDYLLRTFLLFRLEAAHGIRRDLTDAISRAAPRVDLRSQVTFFSGWARMATKIDSLTVTEVNKPYIGEKVPSRVLAEVRVSLAAFEEGDVRDEWEQVAKHDVLFLVSVHPPIPELNAESKIQHLKQQRVTLNTRPIELASSATNNQKSGNTEIENDRRIAAMLGIVAVRGCEVVAVKDEAGFALSDQLEPHETRKRRTGDIRYFSVLLDPAQYQEDIIRGKDIYHSDGNRSGFNLLIRRKSKENNFRSVLESIRDLMQMDETGQAVPKWLQDLLLGYGDPRAAHYKVLLKNERWKCSLSDGAKNAFDMDKNHSPKDEVGVTMDFRDTFIDEDHLLDSFRDRDVSFVEHTQKGRLSILEPSYRITFLPSKTNFSDADKCGNKGGDKMSHDSQDNERLVVESYQPLNFGPYKQDESSHNVVRFTPRQVEAIRSGMSPGLTVVVGPPGTGKTDVAVQILVNLYHNFPQQKTLVVTHSNSALNDIFQKLANRDISERYVYISER